MSALAARITAELRALIGQPMGGCWRAANMQIFEFGPRLRIVNRKGEDVETSDVCLHVQCRWRLVDVETIIFGSDDINYPADESVSLDEFDWDKHQSVLDAVQRQWFNQQRGSPLKVEDVRGDAYGGFKLEFEGGVALEAFPCDSRRSEYSEQWRIFGHRVNRSHFVVTSFGVEGELAP
jgi:hypothetical protein